MSLPSCHLHTFNALYRQLDHLFHETAIRCGLSDAGFILMYGLYVEPGPRRLQEMSELSGMPKQTVHSALRKLMQRDFIIQDEARCFALTPAGKAFAQVHIRPFAQAEASFLDSLSPEHRTLLFSLMAQYTAALSHCYDQEVSP